MHRVPDRCRPANATRETLPVVRRASSCVKAANDFADGELLTGRRLECAGQFTEGQVLPGLAEVLKVFAADEHGEIVDGWTLASWLRTGLDELDGDSVADRLLAGDTATARQAAAHAAARWSR